VVLSRYPLATNDVNTCLKASRPNQYSKFQFAVVGMDCANFVRGLMPLKITS